jgi:hypothetical protein
MDTPFHKGVPVPTVHSVQVGWWDSFRIVLKGQIMFAGIYLAAAAALFVLTALAAN